MRPRGLSRRAFLALGGSSLLVRPSSGAAVQSGQPADYVFQQFHNQTSTSTLHHRLVEMWEAIRAETNGRVRVEVFAENARVEGSDPAVLRMLVDGEIQFFTLMGGILSNLVPAADVQQVPFAFGSPADAHKAMDGALGTYLRRELEANGIFAFNVGAFDNGMRQIATATRPIAVPQDLVGLKIRVPDGRLFRDTFAALGAEPIVINVDGIYGGLRSRRVDAQENPLAVVEQFHLDEVVRYVSMTNHMWSGFNLLAHLPTWRRLPGNVRSVIERNATKFVRLQREDQMRLNDSLKATLTARGLAFNDVDRTPFRARLSGVYATWRIRLGTRCWSLLEATTGPLR